MSLAMYAAPFDNESEEINMNKEYNNKNNVKKNLNNKTQKRYPSAFNSSANQNSEKVMSVLQTMQNLPPSSSDLGDFKPLPPPSSAGVESTILRDNEASKKKQQGFTSHDDSNKNIPSNFQDNYYSNLNDDGDEEFSTTLLNPTQIIDEKYKKMIPNYEEMYKNYGYSNVYNPTNSIKQHENSSDVLIDKLNYMIHLLEETQDEKTNNVTEEVILYSFLGIFVIFIVDSFARVGKYTR
jgi:hypothetical protein